MRTKILINIGDVFGMLTVIEKTINPNIGGTAWKVVCACGKERLSSGFDLKNGRNKSCGCSSRNLKNRIKHGAASSTISKRKPEYIIWQHMKSRCFNKKGKAYANYGGRGITVCEEWVNDYVAFYNHIGDRPTKKHSIDRFPNNNGNYEPNNVRWATKKQQMQNLRKNVLLTFNNETKILSEWARYFQVNTEALRQHLKMGRTIDQIAAHYKLKKDKNMIRLTWKESSRLLSLV